MKHITREELIKLISNFQQRIAEKLGPHDKHGLKMWHKSNSAIFALHEAKPAMTIEIERDPKYGGPSLEVLRFDDLGDGKHHLFAAPCSPAKAKDAEGWSVVPDTPTPSMTLQGALAGVSHANGKFSQKGAEAVYKAMLDASRDPDRHSGDEEDESSSDLENYIDEIRQGSKGKFFQEWPVPEGWTVHSKVSIPSAVRRQRIVGFRVSLPDSMPVSQATDYLPSLLSQPGKTVDQIVETADKMAEALETVMELIEPTWPVEIDIMKSAQSVLESYRREKEKTEQ